MPRVKARGFCFLFFCLFFTQFQAWAISDFSENFESEFNPQERAYAQEKVLQLVEAYLANAKNEVKNAREQNSSLSAKDQRRLKRLANKLRVTNLLKLTLNPQDLETTLEYFRIKFFDESLSKEEREIYRKRIIWDVTHLSSAFRVLGQWKEKQVQLIGDFMTSLIESNRTTWEEKKQAIVAMAQIILEAQEANLIPQNFWNLEKIGKNLAKNLVNHEEINDIICRLEDLKILSMNASEIKNYLSEAQKSGAEKISEAANKSVRSAILLLANVETSIELYDFKKNGLRQFAISKEARDFDLNDTLVKDIELYSLREKDVMSLENHQIWKTFLIKTTDLMRQGAFQIRHLR